MITSVKGMRDLLPPDTRVWNRLEETTRAVFSLYGYDEIRTPSLEPTELFVRSVGEASDIVHKEMYSFTDRGGREVSLRPENTAGVARAFIEHGMPQAGGVKKLYYVGPQYRYERPQKGRFREFRQIGAEVLGAADPATDAELLVMLFDLLARLGFTGLSVSLNSVGSEESRPAYVEALRAYLHGHEEKLGEDDRRRQRVNPLRVLDTKDRSLADVVAGAPRVLDHLDADSLAHHEELLALLDAERIPYRVEPRLVRGLDYYTRTVFEVTAQGLGAQDALLGGGRYDRLVSDLGGPKTPGIGFAIGEDRLVDVLPEAFRRAAIEGFAPVALVAIEPSDRAAALALASSLRREGIAVDLDPSGKGPGAGLKSASKRGCRRAILLGQRERESGVVIVKDLVERSQHEVPIADLARVLKGDTP
ncbi:MAG: histidine--tRNA ligase [Thermoanaerobaculia bacterium]|nr:histidine--tRNA ligase [Thermoanaerobaculia bacterium]